MAVKSTPVLHEEVDYAEMCARLQEKISGMEGQMALRLQEQQLRHEHALREARGETVRPESETLASQKFTALRLGALEKVLAHIAALRGGKSSDGREKPWLASEKQKQAPEVFPLFSYSYELLRAVTDEVAALLRENLSRDEADRESLLVRSRSISLHLQ